MNSMKNSINILDNVFVIQRIVDPKHKKIITLDNDIKIDNNHKCFEFWKTGSACCNCISMRALNENSSFSKLEYVDEKLYMVISAPINVEGDVYIVELIKDVTNDTMFSTYTNKTVNELKSEINKLNMLIVTDELTNIFNRRYLDEHLPSLLKNLSLPDFSVSLIMLDIDKFKNINDTYGHLCGDFIIKEVASLLDSYIKNFGGWACRYGGDEFIAVVENKSENETYALINNFKTFIGTREFLYENNKINITCSFGVSYLNNENITFNDALNLVDSKLYKAKNSRNSVC
ncbi:diguanylate cyclase domain protein [[Clostridium] bifermentans ATCC 638]|uniref:Diguanylate cyclase domain protein n=2 Tax=Paraclostridium bifermentans TaxID=1490 RepID=T4VPD5_PARBF|nr:diguanylate cyclase domain protein [[Clostridium] bifermentans ATCC 638] [Paraclostridium bifermentans ATCC 638 = DSM 14991]RIZ60598.1 GGDEF domain-containing protein [Paraclostridium bifermentans]